jgi:hypothetical protein
MTVDVAGPVQAQLDAYNARDLDAFLRCYAPNITLRQSDGTTVLTGIEDLHDRSVAQFGQRWAPCLLVNRLVAGQWVIDDERLLLSEDGRRNVVAYHVCDGLIDQAVGLL